MAWTTPTVVGSGSTSGSTQSSTAATGSVSFVSGKSYICTLVSCDPEFTAHTHDDPTGGITWTLVRSLVPGGSSGDSRISVYVGTCTSGATSAVSTTVRNGGSPLSVHWRMQVEEWDPFTVRNSEVDAGAWTDASASITLPAFADADSAGWSGWMGLVTDSQITHDSGWTELAENTFNDWSEAAQGRLETQYRLDTTDNVATASVTACWYLLGAAMELVHADVGPVPELVTLTPADNATDVSVDTDLVLEFDIDVVAGDGDVRVYELVAPSAPTIELRTTDTTGTGDTTSFAVGWSVPGTTYQEGDKIYVLLSKDDDDAWTAMPPTDWNVVFNTNSGTATRVAMIWRRFAAGATTNSVTVGGDNESYAARIWLVRGAHRTTDPYAPTSATGTSTGANPPSATIPWGAEPTHVFAVCGGDGNGSASAYPSSSSNTGTHHSGHTTTGSRSWLAYCEFSNVTAGSLDPSAFTNTNEEWVAQTVCIRPHDPSVLVETIDITDTGQVTFAADTVTIELTDPLDPETPYFVLVDAGAIIADE